MFLLLGVVTALLSAQPPCCGAGAPPVPASAAEPALTTARRRHDLPTGWTLGAEVGAGVPERLTLLDREVASTALLGSAAAGYVGVLRGPLLYEAAVEAHALRRTGRIGEAAFGVRRVTAGVGLALGLRLPPRGWAAFAGASVRNRIPYREFDARRDDNLRVDARLSVRHAVGGRLALAATLAHALPAVGDANALLDPRARLTAGARWTLTRPR